jgi:hypothetical protein
MHAPDEFLKHVAECEEWRESQATRRAGQRGGVWRRDGSLKWLNAKARWYARGRSLEAPAG